ncbi:TIGR03086 family metal-binding protein [Kitasatospora sp. NBC_00240]|uniref:TIGR03086 family metal-binding protein n=1 Tax=Kitasatospora sp. NBC_00240 TaxID=2903567 RepID=UPI00224CCEC0|nr:TIGR03086 family metal-binding protein [Kitasatospora sp. NBC_00240]MCX5214439.1 TIGR03086 family metal-binding protein [Kitasatospora sp. NBC_00240]
MSDTDADTGTTDPVELLARALLQAGAVVAATGPDQGALPTPCRSWDVTDLVSHLLDDLRQFTVRANGGTPDWKAPTERVTQGWAQAFESGAEELLAAWRRAGDLSGVLDVPGMGELPARFPVDQQTAELAVHSWDLATATGQPTDLDETVGRAALDWGRGALQPKFRGAESEGRAFGPEVPAGPDAPVYDRLAAWFGRPPADD